MFRLQQLAVVARAPAEPESWGTASTRYMMSQDCGRDGSTCGRVHAQFGECYTSATHDQVRSSGTAERVTDRALIEDIWKTNPLLRSYLGTPDNPELILYRVVPHYVRFMREWALDYHDIAI